MSKKLGFWLQDNYNLPVFTYTGKLPYQETLSNGQKVKLPEDPWFILGNPQITVFAHVGGEMEIITGRRSWGRMNFGQKRNSYVNGAVLHFGDREYELLGTEGVAGNPEKCRRSFGCGYAEYEYNFENVSLKRVLSVKPADNPKGGEAGILVTVEITNKGNCKTEGAYTEILGVNYKEIQYQWAGEDFRQVEYEYVPFSIENGAGFEIRSSCKDPLLCQKPEDMEMIEGFPPYMAIKAEQDTVRVSAETEEGFLGRYLKTESDFSIMPGETLRISFLIGVLHSRDRGEMNCLSDKMKHNECTYSKEWADYLPMFTEEKDVDLKRELIWHAYSLEGMATYSEYYDETKIPQGTCYDYEWGKHASARDNFQHALPLAYYNPTMCKSVIRYMLERTTPFGEVRLIESGVGYAEHEGYFTSDQQLFLFLLIAEYLRITKDYAILDEQVQPYPVRDMAEMSVLKMLEKCFVFLKGTIRFGAHGIVRLYNSDWNDTVYYIEKVPYNTVVLTGESHMNSAMAVSILERLTEELQQYAREKEGKAAADAEKLAESMKLYQENVFSAFMEDLGERTFPRRMYFAGKPYGEENMFLEPMGYTLLMKNFPLERKEKLYEEMKKRLYEGEILGAREQENPEFESDTYEKGSRENGGFWWALNGPVIMGLSTFAPEEAEKRLKQMTLKHLAEVKPEFWSSYWSAADNLESALIIENGLPDQTDIYADMPVYCAHPHAWILYCYYYLRDKCK